MIFLLNNDVEILNSDWLEALLEHGQRNEVGAVGGKLYYPNGTIQHAGVIVGISGFAGHSHRHYKKRCRRLRESAHVHPECQRSYGRHVDG